MPPFDGGQLNRLLVRLQRGDGGALDGVLAVAGKRMLALAQGILGNRADAEDAVQESFLKIARSVHGFRIDTNGYAWVMRIVRNTALDMLRKRKRRAEENIDEFFSLTDGSYSEEGLAEAVALERAVARLQPDERKIIYYRYYLDFTVRDIARETGASKSAVQRTLDRAEKQLKIFLGAGQNPRE
ncbi:MAG: RNA polymerase sigma factor [Clostridia bacterium]|nr:RNA polymerase sigma factor [Clostridia bacterium]